jgi:hypothetical protein
MIYIKKINYKGYLLLKNKICSLITGYQGNESYIF